MKNKLSFIVYLRCLAAIAVVFIHICMTLPNNSTIETLGPFNFCVFNIGYILSKWAVPVFLMISGYLYLDINKEYTFNKLLRHALKIVIVLVVFGIGYSCLEIIYTDGFENWYLILPKAILMTVQQKSWDHLRYLYALIGIYLLTPLFRALFKCCKTNYILFLIVFLYLINFVIPVFNGFFEIKLTTLYISISSYLMYFLIGGYLVLPNNLFDKKRVLFYIIGLFCLVITIIIESVFIYYNETIYYILSNNNILVPFIALSIFLLAKNFFNGRQVNIVIDNLANCSFGIYLIHPLFINLLYKYFDFSPLSMNIFLGIFVLFIIVFLLSWVVTFLLKFVPFVKKII